MILKIQKEIKLAISDKNFSKSSLKKLLSMYDCKKAMKSLSQNAISTKNMKKQELSTKNDTKTNITSNFIGYNVSNTLNLIHSQALSEKTLQKSKNYYRSGTTIRKYDKMKFLKN